MATSFSASLFVAIVQHMEEPTIDKVHTVELPCGLPLLQVTALVQVAFDRLVAERLAAPGVTCACCQHPVKGHSRSVIMRFEDATAVTYLNMIGWIMPFCTEQECLLKCEDIRHFVSLDFDKKFAPLNGVEKASKANLRLCNYCHRMQHANESKFRVCARCKEMYYCSEACLQASWQDVHKRSCPGAPPETRAALVAKELPATLRVRCAGIDTEFTFDLVAPAVHEEVSTALFAVNKAPRLLMTWLEYITRSKQTDILRQIDTTQPPIDLRCVACNTPVSVRHPRWSWMLGVNVTADGVLALTGVMAFVCKGKDGCSVVADRILAQTIGNKAANRLNDCFHCHRVETADGVKFKRCARCKARWYCSSECQREDWEAHKSACRPAT